MLKRPVPREFFTRLRQRAVDDGMSVFFYRRRDFFARADIDKHRPAGQCAEINLNSLPKWSGSSVG
ncbi:hypothetical protein N2384_08510 [Bacillus paralicheniformis]|uniref:hypothetical protein n=1 Tax=Bacillus paralicheniformis TaxID=1648923 RepID=UPI0021A4C36F|nr:hypothetical protein [Bacillus paralicheniformis]UWS62913.1 hypothetical protein N2384_08510 [Bacillus paralicheniformis]